MFKRLLIIIWVLFFFTQFPASAENWTYLTKSERGSRIIYIDRDSIVKYNDTATARIKFAERNGYSMIGKVELSKTAYTYIPLSGMEYSSRNQLIWQGSFDNTAKMIAPNSAIESAYEFIWPDSKKKWLLISSINNEDPSQRVYLDLKNIERDGDTATFYTRIGDDKFYLLSKFEMSKNSRTHKLLSYQFVDKGEIFMSETAKHQTDAPINPGDDFDKIYKFIWPKG